MALRFTAAVSFLFDKGVQPRGKRMDFSSPMFFVCIGCVNTTTGGHLFPGIPSSPTGLTLAINMDNAYNNTMNLTIDFANNYLVPYF